MRPSRLTAFTLALTTLAYFGNSVYLPFVEHMGTEFGASAQSVQLSLSAYLIGLGVPQLVYGPLSDRYGRRPVLIAAFLMFVAASVFCIVAESIGIFIVARALQGMSASASVVISRAIIRDAFLPADRQKVIGYVGVASAMGPILGPIIFGALLPEPWWRASLAFMAVAGIVMLAATSIFFAETRPRQAAGAPDPRNVLSSIMTLLRHREFLAFTASLCASYGAMFCWYSWAGFILIGDLGIPPSQFGYFFAVTIFGFMAGSFIGGRAAQKAPMPVILLAGSATMLAAALALLGVAFLGLQSAGLIVVIVMTLNCGVGIVMPQSLMLALRPFTFIAGTASAVLGTTQMLVSGVVATLPGLIGISSVKSMSVTISLLSAVCTATVCFFSKSRQAPAV